MKLGNRVMANCLFLCLLGGVANAAEPQKDLSALDHEKQLFLTPAGKYTAADIAANEKMTRSQKFQKCASVSDSAPQKGDVICPITNEKADPKYTWIVDGKTYQFCCPLCIDEFIVLAKTKPEEIKDPAYYVK